ncbi:MAG: hypothetical protein WC641_05925 [Patescibacteria group bacterium]
MKPPQKISAAKQDGHYRRMADVWDKFSRRLAAVSANLPRVNPRKK